MGPIADILFAATAAVYAAASVLFVAHLIGTRSTFAIAWAPRLVGIGAALHAGHIILSSLVLNVCPIKGMHFAMSVISMLACVGYTLARARIKPHDAEAPSFDVVGVFVAPIALTFFMASRLVNAHEPGGTMKGAILPVHVLVSLLGEALFLLAFAAAVAYLVQEKQLKKKKLTGVFLRLPPLDALERAEHRFLLAGFPLLTIGILTGTLWAYKVEAGSSAEVWRAVFGYATWALFAAVLLLRRAAGWRGKKAAYGTIAGFGLAVIVLALYLVRALGASA
jgi:ABC-type uncharacterized transport system permease subunit